jgi:hypothetical protein
VLNVWAFMADDGAWRGTTPEPARLAVRTSWHCATDAPAGGFAPCNDCVLFVGWLSELPGTTYRTYVWVWCLGTVWVWCLGKLCMPSGVECRVDTIVKLTLSTCMMPCLIGWHPLSVVLI